MLKKALVLAARVVFRLSVLPGVGPIFEKLANLLGRRRVVLQDIRDLSAESQTLWPGGPSHAVSPNHKSHLAEFPDISAHLLRDVLVTADSSHISTHSALLAPTYRITNQHKIPANPRSLGYAGGGVIYTAQSHHRFIEKAIMVDGDGGSNWYHFLIECLPKVYLAERLAPQYSDFPLLVSYQTQAIPNFRHALELFSGSRQVIALSPVERVRVSELVAIDEIVHAPFNLHRGLWPVVQDYAQHDDLLRTYFRTLRERIGLHPRGANAKRRIYLARPAGRRSHNQDELIEIAMRHGFEAVSPERMSLNEQAQLFADADSVIGASGAAWANIAFSASPMRGLSWLIPQYDEFSTYSSLARLVGCDLSFVRAKPVKPIKSSHAAYSASYRIDPAEFEASVKRLVEKG